MKRSASSTAAGIAFLYLIIGVVWVFYSDGLVASVLHDPQVLTKAQSYKGWAFVVISSLLLFGLLRKILKGRQAVAAALQKGREAALFAVEASRILAGVTGDPVDALVDIARAAVPAFADWCVVDLLGEDGIKRRVAVIHSDPHRHAEADQFREIDLQAPHRVATIKRLLAAGQPSLYEHLDRLVREAPDVTEQELRLIRAVGICAGLAVPVGSDGNWFAVFSFYMAESGRSFSTAQLNVARDLGTRVGVALHRGLQSAQLRGLADASLAIHGTRNLAETLQVITTQARQIIGVHLAGAELITPEGRIAAGAMDCSEKYAPYRAYHRSHMEGGILRWMLEQQVVVRLAESEVTSHPAFAGFGGSTGHPPLRGLLAIPMVGRDGQPLGIIQLSDKYEGEFTATDEDILQQLARMGALALENNRLYLEARGTEAALREQGRLYRLIADNSTDVIILLGADKRFQYISPSCRAVLGFTAPEMMAMNKEGVAAKLHPDDREQVRQAFRAALKQEECVTFTYRFYRPDGAYVWMEAAAGLIVDEQAVPQLRIATRDITERKRFEEQLAFQAFHDPMTGLPNRSLFVDRLEQSLVRSRTRQEPLAVFFLDLDGFKAVNDSLGHQVGDQLLAAIGDRLRSCVRPQDTVARLHGDEFTILLESVRGESGALQTAESIQQAFQQPFTVVGHEVFVGASMGIAFAAPGRYANSAAVLRDADMAMYRAKSRGRSSYELYDPSMNQDTLEILELEIDLRRALERTELRVYYQPIVEMESGRMAGMEALVRWQHPRKGLIGPGLFIPLAEETGLVVQLDLWVLKEACGQLKAWQAEHGLDPSVYVSVNLSARQFQQADLVAEILQVLDESGLEPGSLQLEITESALMQDTEGGARLLKELKQAGIRLALDDFGTGYCSLSYLQRFPVDTLKIDRSFVNGPGHAPADEAILRAIMAVGKALNLTVTAEGVETPEQALQLRSLGCDLGQGFLWSQPVPDGLLAERFLPTRKEAACD
ncbi:MAG: EAL domain-containing protein [Mycobacterium leprae]